MKSIREIEAEDAQNFGRCEYYGKEDIDKCGNCISRFKCWTESKLYPYSIIVTYTSWDIYKVFAANEEDAKDVFEEFGTNICEYVDTGHGDDAETEIEPYE